jgi:hypothetical protein
MPAIGDRWTEIYASPFERLADRAGFDAQLLTDRRKSDWPSA